MGPILSLRTEQDIDAASQRIKIWTRSIVYASKLLTLAELNYHMRKLKKNCLRLRLAASVFISMWHALSESRRKLWQTFGLDNAEHDVRCRATSTAHAITGLMPNGMIL